MPIPSQLTVHNLQLLRWRGEEGPLLFAGDGETPIIPAVPVKPQVDNWPLAILVLVLSCVVAIALGLAIGANIKPQTFSIVVMAITFLGCIYYPWA